jgi:hypothetical protein
VLESVPHRHVVLTMPRLLRGIFRKRRELLLDLSQCGAEALAEYMRTRVGPDTRPGIVVSIATSRPVIDQPEVRLVDEVGRLQRVIPPLAAQVRRGPATKLLVDQRQQPVPRAEITVAPSTEELGHVVARSAHTASSDESCWLGVGESRQP